MTDQSAQIDKVGLRRGALSQRGGFPFADELLRRHSTDLCRTGIAGLKDLLLVSSVGSAEGLP
jgi:hypothetical protein